MQTTWWRKNIIMAIQALVKLFKAEFWGFQASIPLFAVWDVTCRPVPLTGAEGNWRAGCVRINQERAMGRAWKN